MKANGKVCVQWHARANHDRRDTTPHPTQLVGEEAILPKRAFVAVLTPNAWVCPRNSLWNSSVHRSKSRHQPLWLPACPLCSVFDGEGAENSRRAHAP